MPDTDDNQTQRGADGAASPAKSAGSPGEERSFAGRLSDTEAAHHNEGGHSFRSAHTGPIGGDMGRDEDKGPGQGAEEPAGASGSKGGPQGLPPNSPGGIMEHQDPSHADDLDKVSGQASAAGDDLGGDKDDTYSTSTVEANHIRQQGGGMGLKDLAAQRDPNRGDTTDQFGQTAGNDGGEEQA